MSVVKVWRGVQVARLARTSSIRPRAPYSRSVAPSSLVCANGQRFSTSNHVQRTKSSFADKLVDPEKPPKVIRDFDVDGRVFVVTGGARGLGLSMAQALVESGGHVHCLDRLPEPSSEYRYVQDHIVGGSGGSLHYDQVDVRDVQELDDCVSMIADRHRRLDGLVAAAGIQNAAPALDYKPDDLDEMMAINHKGVFLAAQACARQMVKYKCAGSLLLVGSSGGLAAIKGFRSSIYSSSKAAVHQLARSLAMEWGQIIDGKPIRVNALAPGNTLTPMVKNDIKIQPELESVWSDANMLGRLSDPSEYRGAALFLLSDASSFVTGSCLVVDGGYTAW